MTATCVVQWNLAWTAKTELSNLLLLPHCIQPLPQIHHLPLNPTPYPNSSLTPQSNPLPQIHHLPLNPTPYPKFITYPSIQPPTPNSSLTLCSSMLPPTQLNTPLNASPSPTNPITCLAMLALEHSPACCNSRAEYHSCWLHTICF